MKGEKAKVNTKTFINRSFLGRDIILVSGLTTVVMSSSITIDAFNPIKFLVMCCGVFYLSLRYRRVIWLTIRHFRVSIFFAAGIGASLITLFMNQEAISERIFGIDGRNFGFVSAVSLFALGFITFSAKMSGVISDKSLFFGFALTNSMVLAIFFIQLSGWGFTNLSDIYQISPSSLGNPNFLSAFLAISMIGILGIILDSSGNRKMQLFSILQFLISFYVLLKVQSLQGILSLSIGVIVLFLTIAFKFSLRFIKPKLAILSCLIVLFALSSTLSLAYDSLVKSQTTFLFRTIYWKIAIAMFRESPLIGHGFDSYLDNFRRFLNTSYLNSIGPGVISDSPHNLFLDFFVSGGFFLGGIFVLVICIALFGSFKMLFIINKSTFTPNSNDIVLALLITFLCIAFVSPFQLGLFIWLPVVLAIASSPQKNSTLTNQDTAKVLKNSKLSSVITYVCIAVTLLCSNPVVGSLLLMNDVRYRDAVESGNYYKLKAVALAWPFSGQRTITIAQGFLNTSLEQSASPDVQGQAQYQVIRQTSEELAVYAINVNPKDYEALRFLYINATDKLIKEQARKKLRVVDPFNGEWRRR